MRKLKLKCVCGHLVERLERERRYVDREIREGGLTEHLKSSKMSSHGGRVRNVIRFNPGPANLGRGGIFRPRGRVFGKIRYANPEAWAQGVTWGARVFVGLSVGNRRCWTLGQVVEFVKRRWRRGASFLAQKGLWRSGRTRSSSRSKGTGSSGRR